MRLFIALDIDDPIRERIARFVDGVARLRPRRALGQTGVAARDSEVYRRATRSRSRADQASLVLRSSASVGEIHFRGYGFFPTAKSARVFWIGMEADPQLPSLAAAVDENLAPLGIPKEDRAFSPHLTLARGRRRFRLAPAQQERRPKSHLPAPAGKTGRPAPLRSLVP